MYDGFLKAHVISSQTDANADFEWKLYLSFTSLCDIHPTLAFMEGRPIHVETSHIYTHEQFVANHAPELLEAKPGQMLAALVPRLNFWVNCSSHKNVMQ
jgi:hypothetical protein